MSRSVRSISVSSFCPERFFALVSASGATVFFSQSTDWMAWRKFERQAAVNDVAWS
jgi:hypothetical protein